MQQSPILKNVCERHIHNDRYDKNGYYTYDKNGNVIRGPSYIKYSRLKDNLIDRFNCSNENQLLKENINDL